MTETKASAGATTRLVLVRHGRTAWNVEQRAQGQADIGLDAVGRAQARQLAPAVAALSPQLLWSSDLARARETAAEIETLTGLRAELDPRLREIDVGAREGLRIDEFAARFPDAYAAWSQGRAAGLPGEEPVDSVASRVVAALEDMLGRLGAGECGVVVAHGYCLTLALPVFLGLGHSERRLLHGLDNCAWAEIDIRHGERRLRAYNRVAAPPNPPSGDARPDFASTDAVG